MCCCDPSLPAQLNRRHKMQHKLLLQYQKQQMQLRQQHSQHQQQQACCQPLC
jgi:hypothetical protein